MKTFCLNIFSESKCCLLSSRFYKLGKKSNLFYNNDDCIIIIIINVNFAKAKLTKMYKRNFRVLDLSVW